MTIHEGGVYVLVNGKSGSVLDLSGTDGYSILGWNRHNGDNQKWELSRHNNQWVFRNVGTGRFLGLGGHVHDNTPVRAVDEPVPWDIFPDERDGSVHRIYVPGTPFNVDLSDYGNTNNGTPVNIWGRNENNTNQTWRFEQA
ncbi:putative ricin-type beta-trefoil lectin domain-like [Lyophyllum shimeji]|uniref:Ricin-type beta-trefoil lectin domain-like n=1 Tax=Lyophyllum shimeji TaxID=47721 RepID=A0A9P3URJ0_LYOSH|nr:putative ricin-type beta-trefoil lectin domain-like [Lyophyllum shimeji]